jgi:DNA-binding response OmpR family regulator
MIDMATETPQPRVLVVDDEEETRIAVCESLRWAGMLCSEAGDVARARRVIARNRPDIVVLDLSLPDGDGLELLRELRAGDDLPVLVLSGRSEEHDRISGLDLGADDYLTKPFSAKELASRIRTVLRRSQSARSGSRLTFGNIVIDIESRDVRRGGQALPLTTKEFDLLVFFAKNPRTVYSRADLLREVWTAPGDRGEATVTEHVRRLRMKIEDTPTDPRYLCAVRGVGYRLVP